MIFQSKLAEKRLFCSRRIFFAAFLNCESVSRLCFFYDDINTYFLSLTLQFAEQKVSDRRHVELWLDLQTFFRGTAGLEADIISLVGLIISGRSLWVEETQLVNLIRLRRSLPPPDQLTL